MSQLPIRRIALITKGVCGNYELSQMAVRPEKVCHAGEFGLARRGKPRLLGRGLSEGSRPGLVLTAAAIAHTKTKESHPDAQSRSDAQYGAH